MPDPAQQPGRGRACAEHVDQPLRQDLQLGRQGAAGSTSERQLAPDPVCDAGDQVFVTAEAPYGAIGAIGVTARSAASRCIVRGVRPSGAGVTMTSDGLRFLQDPRRSLLEPPRQLRPRTVTTSPVADTPENVSATA